MYSTVYIQSAVRGVLMVNGTFCGPMEEEGQAFPAGRNAEIYIQLFPFGETPPLTAAMRLSRGRVESLAPAENAYALEWPDGVIQLELRSAHTAQHGQDEQERVPAGTLLRFLSMLLAGDAQAKHLLMGTQELPDLSAYTAAIPMRFAPLYADPRYDERAGLLRRRAENVAAIDTALAATVPAGQGMRRIERIEILPT